MFGTQPDKCRKVSTGIAARIQSSSKSQHQLVEDKDDEPEEVNLNNFACVQVHDNALQL